MAIRFQQIELAGIGHNLYPTIAATGSGQMVQLQSEYGYLQLGSNNSSYAHIQTDRSNFYFNQQVKFDGNIAGYDGNETASFATYYDSQDTNYYVDPNGQSRMSTLNLGSSPTSGITGGYIAQIRGNMHMTNNAIDYVSQLHFYDDIRFYDNGNDQDLNLKFGDASVGHLRFLDGSGNYEGGVYNESGYFGTLASDGSWAVQSSTTLTNIHHYLNVNDSIRTPIYYDKDNTTYFLDPAATDRSMVTSGSISIGTTGQLGLGDITHPKIVYPGKEASWDGSGSTTGQVVIDLPGTLANYDMMYMEIHIYEYGSDAASKIIIGGHNWNSGGNSNTSTTQWYNNGVQVIGSFSKPIYLGRRNDGSNERRCIALGDVSSTWSYGTVHVAKVHGACYYTDSIDWMDNWNVAQTTSSSYFTANPTTNWNTGATTTLKTPGRIHANYVTGAVDTRSPIYYDSNDTNYYVNPATNSVLKGTVTVHADSDSALSVVDGGTNAIGIYAHASDELYLGSNNASKLRIHGGGAIESYADFRAPIFYDSNNTSYYVNPAGTSVMNDIELDDYIYHKGDTDTYLYFETDSIKLRTGGTDRLTLTNTQAGFGTDVVISSSGTGGSPCLRINNLNHTTYNHGIEVYNGNLVAGESEIILMGKTGSTKNSGYIGYNWAADASNNNYVTIGQYGANHIFRVYGDHVLSTVSLRSNADVRGTLFYDVDDTNYYLNPAGASHLGSVDFSGILSGTQAGCAKVGRNHAYDTLELKGYGAELMIGAQHTAMNINYRTCNNGASGHTPQTWYWRDGTSTGFSNHEFDRVTGHESVRSPIFYDSNNTNYYLNPDNTSTSLRTKGDWRSDDSGWSGEFAGKIQYHGNNWYFQAHDAGTMVYRNASGVNKFTFDLATTIGTTAGSWRAPMFYDSNDTGYYLDPAGASNIGTLNVQSVNASVGVKTPNQNTNYASHRWAVGTANPQLAAFDGNYSMNGTTSENSIGYGTTPFGDRGLLWLAQNNDSASGADGGWEKDISNLHDDKAYISIVYVKRVGTSTNGTYYHGCHGSHTLNLDGSSNGNPYFIHTNIGNLPQDVWCVSIGIIQANNDSNTSQSMWDSIKGIYRLDTGDRIHNTTTFKMADGSTTQRHRIYMYYSTDSNAELHFYNPGFYEMNGQEPSLNDLVNGNGSELTAEKLTLSNGFTISEAGSNYANVNSWMYLQNNTGLYAPGNSAHFYPNTTSDYGAWRMDGAKNNWNGITFAHSSVFNTLMSNNVAMGLYNDTDNEWYIEAARNSHLYLYFNGVIQAQTNDGYFVANNQMRSPIFYDNDNTSYYLNPADTSTSLATAGKWFMQGSHSAARWQINYAHGSDATNSGALTAWVSEPGITYENSGIGGNIHVNGQYYGRAYDDGYGVYLRFNKGDGAMEGWNTTGTAGASSGQGTRRWWCDSGGNFYAQTSMRAPIFYDSDDTGYYLNPASSSVLNSATFAGSVRIPVAWDSSTLENNAIYAKNSNDGFGMGNGTGISTWWAWSTENGLMRMIDCANSGAYITLRTSNTDRVTINSTGATFAGTITSGNISVTGGSGGNGQIDVLRTSGANVRIQSQSATGVLGVTTNNPLHLKTNDTTRVTIAAGGDATFAGQLTGTGYVRSLGTYQITMDSASAAGPVINFGSTSDWDAYGSIGHQAGDYRFISENRDYTWIQNSTQHMQLKTNGELDVVSNITTENTFIYINDNGTKWQFGSKALMGNNRFGARYYDGSNWASTAFSVQSNGNFAVTGALTKGSGSFKIDHPIEAKKDTHYLVHSFVEAPQADNIYRGKVDLVDGKAEINIDTVAGMTEGTFVLLNTNVQCFTTNESNWDLVKGNVVGNKLTIESKNASSTASISWMVVGERQDQHMKDTDWTDDNGKVLVEPRKEYNPDGSLK